MKIVIEFIVVSIVSVFLLGVFTAKCDDVWFNGSAIVFWQKIPIYGYIHKQGIFIGLKLCDKGDRDE